MENKQNCSNCSEIQHKLAGFFDYVMKSYHQTFSDQNKALIDLSKKVAEQAEIIKKLEQEIKNYEPRTT